MQSKKNFFSAYSTKYTEALGRQLSQARSKRDPIRPSKNINTTEQPRYSTTKPRNVTQELRLIELRVYVAPDTKQVILETFFPADLLT